MSYCRFSSDNWTCDVYVYEDCSGGWTTHTAGNRPLNIPIVTASPTEEFGEWVKQRQAQTDALDNCDRKAIDHEWASRSFNDPTPGKCADRLVELRAAGFNVPQYAIDALREDACLMSVEDWSDNAPESAQEPRGGAEVGGDRNQPRSA